MTPTEEIAACKGDIEDARRRLTAGEISEREAGDLIGFAERRIEYLEGRGAWFQESHDR